VLYADWRADDEPDDLERIGVVDGPYLEQASETARAHFRSHVERLDGAGYDVEHIDLFPDIEEVNDRHTRLVAAETALSHAELFPEYGDRYADATADLIREGHDVTVAALAPALAGRTALREHVHGVLDDRDVDLVVSPAAPGPAPEGIDSTGDPVMNLPWTHSGLPTVTIPASETDAGLPIGLQCTARFGFDEWLLSWCRDVRAALA
jgi:Asp-tRNA(Asn)/Glu-tRNA(Gln) amidotransferase A subunit family amidase